MIRADCQRYRQLIDAYTRNELLIETNVDVSGHLDTCASCRHFADDQRRLQMLLRAGLVSEQAPVDLHRRVVHAIGAARRPTRWRLLSWRSAMMTGGLLVASAALLVWYNAASLSAAELVGRASAAERLAAADSTVIHYQVLTVVERRLPDGALHRRRVQVWQHGETSVARRVFDERGELVAGEWRAPDGTLQLFERGEAARTPVTSRLATLSDRDYWTHPLSATAFAALIDVPHAQAVEDARSVRVHGAAGPVLNATLVLARPSLHAIEETIVVSHQDHHHEFRFTEDNYLRLPADAVTAATFQPDAALLPAKAAPVRVAPPALAAIEIDTLRLLDRAGLLVGRQVDVTRDTAGVHVIAWGDAERRRLVRDALRPLPQTAPVTIAPAAAPSLEASPHTSIVVRDINIDPNATIPADAPLRRYLARSSVDDAAMRSEVDEFARQVLDQARQALLHAGVVRDLVERFGDDRQIASLPPAARKAWLTLIAQHAHEIAQDTLRLRRALDPVFFVGSDGAEESASAIEHDVRERVRHLASLASDTDRAIRAAFTTSPEPSTELLVATANFRRDLMTIEALALSLQGPGMENVR